MCFEDRYYKGFDSINWRFVLNVLQVLGVPTAYIHWIRLCISTPKKFVKINGCLEGFFGGKRDLI